MRGSSFGGDLNSPIDWSVLRHLWPFLQEYKGRVALAMAFLVAAKVATLTGPFLLKYIVDGLDAGVQASVGFWLLPATLVIAYGMARFSTILFGELRDTVFGRVTERAMRRVSLAVFRHLHTLELDFHLDRRTGGLSRDIERGTTGVGFLLRFFVFNIAPTLIEITMVSAILLLNYGVSFAMVTVLAIVAYVWFSFKTTEWRTQYVREMNRADSTSNTRAIDSLLNYETVKYFGNEAFEARLYDQALADWEQARRKNRLSLFALNIGQALIVSVAMTIMLLLAASQVQQEHMSLGDFVLINAFMVQLFVPLNFLGFVYREIKGAMANIEHMFALLDRKPAIEDVEGAQPLVLRDSDIRFDQVCFGYQANRQILHDVTFSIGRGQTLAVVGPSGAGKSTLVKLLCGFYRAQRGVVSIDGQDISQVTQSSLRAALGVVPQDTVLFNDSLLENVRYGRPDASDTEVEAAIATANLSQFVMSLPEGLQTRVGERGLKLSGGEKQRVAIARTVLKKPSILLFDEATSSLDSHSERAVLQEIKRLAMDHTSVVIAHRLSTVIEADCIVVLEAGRVVEQGTHKQLLSLNGLYAAMWRVQQSHRDEEGA
ncbi:MAG TPA: ABC transporter ATP-binding protein/permease [Pseudomonadales bacterium]|nr:ABC transporter ATP-binding protein/permease [Pseudomonadales bacterium]